MRKCMMVGAFGADNFLHGHEQMGMMVEGEWREQSGFPAAQGHFIRPQSGFRDWVTPDGSAGPSGPGGFAAAPGRYHLYVSLACPWAHRTLIVRQLKKLEDIISVTVTEAVYGKTGWEF